MTKTLTVSLCVLIYLSGARPEESITHQLSSHKDVVRDNTEASRAPEVTTEGVSTSTTRPQPRPGTNFTAFDDFIVGLGRLIHELHELGHSNHSIADQDEVTENVEVDEMRYKVVPLQINSIDNLFSLAEALEHLSKYTVSPVDSASDALGEGNATDSLYEEVDDSEGHNTHPHNNTEDEEYLFDDEFQVFSFPVDSASGRSGQLTVDDVDRLINILDSGAGQDGGEGLQAEGGNVEKIDGFRSLVDTFQTLSTIYVKHASKNTTSSNVSDITEFAQHSEPGQSHIGLATIVEKLKELLSLEEVEATTTTTAPPTITSTTTMTPLWRRPVVREHDIYQPCELPYVEIAYKMCIMTEVNKKLSWEDAYSYCWRQGGELAQDSVVVKSRRYLNDLYGEAGSGARWPIWVGAKLEEAKEHDGKAEFRWRDGSQVPQFLWSQGQPRRYRKASVPRGTCMVLDGYRSFFGASLPCHFRRRFVCQRRN